MLSQSNNKLLGKLVLIVGGSSGIGFAVATGALDLGAHVVVTGSRQAKADDAVERLHQSFPDTIPSSGAIRGTAVDLAADDAEDQILRLYDFATSSGARKIDHVVITAGDPLRPTALHDIARGDFAHATQVRIIGALLLAKHAKENLVESAGSTFTLTSGVRDVRPAASCAVIAPVAAAVKCMARCLAIDLQPVRVNTVSPGAIKTGLFQKIAGDGANALLEQFAEQTLTKTVGTPEGIADCYICVMTSGFINGTDVCADGGSLLC